MSMSRVTRRYVQGFLGVLDAGRIDAVESALERFDAVLRTSPAVTAVLYHPTISRSKKKALIATLAADAPKELTAFLGYVIDKKRERMLKELHSAFTSAADTVRGIVRSRVSSATPLPEQQLASLGSALNTALGKQVTIETSVDTALLGGLRVFVGSYVIDGTLKSRLERLHRHLLQETTQIKPAAPAHSY